MSEDLFKAVKWPLKLPARIIEPGKEPRIQGYDVNEDLARHYGFAEVMILALTGELPSREESLLFERLLVLLSPANPGSAPTHAASVSRLCGASDAAIIATTAGLLAESVTLAEVSHLGWEENSLKHALSRIMRDSGFEPSWNDDDSLAELISTVLTACGLTLDWQRTTALTLAALPAAIAEASSWVRGDFKSYPMNLPAFRYEENEDE